ncbi:unnamed protein product, partial [Symbiodinium natans]
MAHLLSLVLLVLVVAVASNFQVVSNDYAFALVNVLTGKGACWGDNRLGGNCSSVDFSNVQQVKANADAFLALGTTGGACWGNANSGGDCTGLDFTGMTEVAATDYSFAVLDPVQGRGLCFGSSAYGGDCSGVDFTHASKIYSNLLAFVAIGGSFGQCWGHTSFGGDCSGISFNGVTEVVAGDYAFVALNKAAGTIQCWGFPSYGGDCSAVTLTGITDVYTNGKAFLALNRNSGSGECWGNSQAGNDCSQIDFSGEVQIYTTDSAFLALSGGVGQCWGNPTNGGDCSNVFFSSNSQIASTSAAFVALDAANGIAQCWGSPSFGGDCLGTSFEGLTSVYATSYAFMAMNPVTGAAKCWGSAGFGGECSGDLTGFQIHSNDFAFAAVSAEEVRAWGSSAQGGDTGNVNFAPVLEIPTTVTATTATATSTVTGTTLTTTTVITATATSTVTGTMLTTTTVITATATSTVTGTTLTTTTVITATATSTVTGTTLTTTTVITATATLTVTGTTLPTTTSTQAVTTGAPPSGTCRRWCKWLTRSFNVVCDWSSCSGCEECFEPEPEVPVCKCDKYKGRARGDGYKRYEYLCIRERTRDNVRLVRMVFYVRPADSIPGEQSAYCGAEWGNPMHWCRSLMDFRGSVKVGAEVLDGTRAGGATSLCGSRRCELTGWNAEDCQWLFRELQRKRPAERKCQFSLPVAFSTLTADCYFRGRLLRALVGDILTSLWPKVPKCDIKSASLVEDPHEGMFVTPSAHELLVPSTLFELVFYMAEEDDLDAVESDLRHLFSVRYTWKQGWDVVKHF